MCSLIIDTQKLHKSLINKETPLLGEGLEPSRLTAPEPKSGVSANFTTRAKGKLEVKSLFNLTVNSVGW